MDYAQLAIELLKRETAIHACQELVELVTHHTDDLGNGIYSTAIAQLEFMRESAAPTALCAVYEPTLCLILQGKKKLCWARKPISMVRLNILLSQ